MKILALFLRTPIREDETGFIVDGELELSRDRPYLIAALWEMRNACD